VGQLFTNMAFIGEQFTEQMFSQLWHWPGVMNLAASQLGVDDLVQVVEHEIQFEAKEPAH
jgi:hypothetical protein